MNLSNQLTVSRFGMAFVMSIFLTLPIPFGKTIGLFVFLTAALTDYWDGRLARSMGTVTAFGQLMDPLVDKVLICAAFVSFVAINQIVPAWIVIIILGQGIHGHGVAPAGGQPGPGDSRQPMGQA